MFELRTAQYNNDGRRLSAKQKELIVQFAETERHSSDTKINGVTDKGKGAEFITILLHHFYQKVRERTAQEKNEAFSEK